MFKFSKVINYSHDCNAITKFGLNLFDLIGLAIIDVRVNYPPLPSKMLELQSPSLLC